MRLALAVILTMTLAILGMLGVSYIGYRYLGVEGMVGGYVFAFPLGVLFVVSVLDKLDNWRLL